MRKIIWEHSKMYVCWFWRQGFILYVTVVRSQHEQATLANWPSEKKTCPKINTQVSYCVWQEIGILSFYVTANTKDACLDQRANKGIYFPFIAIDILNRQQAEFFTNQCQNAEPLRLSVSTPVFAYSARLGFLVSNIARCLFLKAAQTARHSSLFWQILTVFKGVIYF